MAEISLDHVSKRFRVDSDFLVRRFRAGGGPVVQDDEEGSSSPGDTWARALDDVTLTIADGETMSLVGPSGCGKSTLLRVVAGLEQADSGRVLYDGRDMTDVPPKDRGIGMVFQNYALYPHMESRMNLGFFFLVRRRTEEIPERVRITADIMGVGFDQLLDRKPKELSGGQQQRVAIARCISRDPVLFLLDEPLSNLDAKLRIRTRVEIKRLLRRFAITTLYVTHDQTEAIALADRITVMNHGRVEQTGTYRQLFDTPVNAFVAGFIGSPAMNLHEVVVAPDRDAVLIEGTRLPIPPDWDIADLRTVLLGLRPEHLRVNPSNPDFLMAVEVVEPLISDRQLLAHGKVGSLPFVARLPEDVEVQRGDILPLSADPDQLHLFHPEDRLRLERHH